MDDATREFNRLLLLAPDAFPPLSAIVHADIAAHSPVQLSRLTGRHCTTGVPFGSTPLKLASCQ